MRAAKAGRTPFPLGPARRRGRFSRPFLYADAAGAYPKGPGDAMTFPRHLPCESIMDSIADGVFTVDLDWNVTFFNRAAGAITGIGNVLPREVLQLVQAL